MANSSMFESDIKDDIDEEVIDDDDEYDDDDDVPKQWDDSASWLSFSKSVFIYFILTLIYGFCASGFIWLTSRGSDIDYILPTNEKFYSAPTYETKIQGPVNDSNCMSEPTGNFDAIIDNFPYNLIIAKGSSKEELAGLSMVQRLTNWFGKMCAGCFKTNRAWFKWWLDTFNPESGIMGSHTFQILLGFPATFVIAGFCSFGTGFWASFASAASADLKVTVYSGFLLFGWGLCFSLMFLVAARFFATICLYPMSQSWKDVVNIFACNVTTFVILFGFFVCGAAYDTLDETIAGIMGIVYLSIIGITIFRHFAADYFI